MANETITGKIFTLKDPTGTYNRFPRTVMEAVYGLNTYLQNQFSSLADIYMPIEGITESKPLQEFVYRLCPSSIKAKSVSLDRIYGKTLAWTQLAPLFNVTGSTSLGWSIENVTSYSTELNGRQINITFSSADNMRFRLYAPVTPGHKYLCSYYIWISSGLTSPSWATNGGMIPSLYGNGAIETGKWVLYGDIVTVGSGADTNMSVVYPNTGISLNGQTMSIRDFEIIDLTLLGIDSYDSVSAVRTWLACNVGLTRFPYTNGILISNDAAAVETVGFNQWDEEWEVGDYSTGDGSKISGSYVRSKNRIKVIPGQDYAFKGGSNNGLVVFEYDANGNYLRRDLSTEAHAGGVITMPSDCYYITFRTFHIYGTTYNHDICINLSDPAKNGTYEPYRKSTMQLNLGSFQVRDSQGNVTTITGGLKSAGSVYDEIVGNKYIKRVGSVDLGTLTWTLGSPTYLDFNASLSDCGSNNVICSKYEKTDSTYHSGIEDKRIGFNSGNSLLYAKDTTYSTAATFQTAMSGVMLYYALATPIEYTLVSPLVPTVKAGETEARISPNSDGLSAPMVADMTYDAQANNDSASAQYALTAGRLLNSHKLWGQDFDGTQDVAGALTGVTSINGILSFDNGVPKINNNTVWHAGNSNKTDVAWNCANLTVGAPASHGLIGCQYSDTNKYNYIDFYGSSYDGDIRYVAGSWTSTDHISHRFIVGVSGSIDALTIKNNGYVGIGQSNPQYKLDVSGTFRATGAATFGSTVHADGGIDSNSYITAGAVNSSSDARLKNGITPVMNAMDTIMALKPSEWIWNEKHHLNGQKGAGLVAQEVEKVLPFAVAKEGEYLSLNYDVFHAYEIAGLQNHEERIKALEAENAELRRRLGA